jgi:hypothetical protein
MRVYEKWVLTIYGPKKDVPGCWRNLHDEELHSPYSSPPNSYNQIEKVSLEKACSDYQVRNAYKILVGTLEEKRLTGILGADGGISNRS